MVTTDSGQDIAAAPLRRGGPISIARALLGAELTCDPSGDVLRRKAGIRLQLDLIWGALPAAQTVLGWRFLTNGTSPVDSWHPGFQRRNLKVLGLALLDNWHQ